MKKKMIVVESALVLVLVIALSITATHTNDNTEAITARDSSARVSLEEGVTAGVAGTFQSIELLTAEELDAMVTIEAGETEHVAATMEADEPEVTLNESDSITDTDEPVIVPEAEENVTAEEVIAERPAALTAEEQEWLSYLMPNVNKSLNVREAASEEADVVGKLYKGDRATIVEQGEEWTKITSGNVEGYVKNELCVFGLDALAYAKANCETVATSTIDGLRVRTEANLEASVAKKLDKGEKLTVDTQKDPVEGWVAVICKSETCYVSADYVEVSLKTGKGVTLEEEAAAEEAKKTSSSSSSSSRKPCALASEVDEVTLLAGIIECEAGGHDYEALLAVGAVVMNRVNSSSYPDNIYDVIHQKGQFPPATSGKLEKWLKKGPGKNAIKAAKAAIAGDDNTDGALNFRMSSSGHSGTVIGDNVFF